MSVFTTKFEFLKKFLLSTFWCHFHGHLQLGLHLPLSSGRPHLAVNHPSKANTNVPQRSLKYLPAQQNQPSERIQDSFRGVSNLRRQLPVCLCAFRAETPSGAARFYAFPVVWQLASLPSRLSASSYLAVPNRNFALALSDCVFLRQKRTKSLREAGIRQTFLLFLPRGSEPQLRLCALRLEHLQLRLQPVQRDLVFSCGRL
jgi:hypothetical protein